MAQDLPLPVSLNRSLADSFALPLFVTISNKCTLKRKENRSTINKAFSKESQMHLIKLLSVRVSGQPFVLQATKWRSTTSWAMSAMFLSESCLGQ